ncbi:outer membrane receptor FepA [Janthinobacterium lividum]|uniref:TonB-dependent receptor n=1 Tax=Janthinobacterium lividum TaxID=29581 RepID=UPI000E082003|nr:TonB-dependent receptor [Janthinobacterium lividum]STR26437.1 outer membrane receptor FepA [Janthinobacterium lividum]
MMQSMATGTRTPRQNTRLTLKATVAALAGAGLLSSASVWAQQAPAVETPVAETVPAAAAPADNGGIAVVAVTGVRRAAQSAQTIKKNNDQVVDSIVADEIGKFPDKNVAEILGRVTGVQVRREGGEAGTVIIRGLPGVVTLLNGREMFTSVGRSLYLADIPTAMLQRVDVYKSQGADMVEGGTAGVIDVRTNRPFDFKGFTASGNVRAEHRDKSGSTDPNVSGMVSNRWKTQYGEFGALLGLSYQRGRYYDETIWNAEPVKRPDAGNITGPDSVGMIPTVGDRKRYAANAAFQWRPNSQVEVYAEGMSTLIKHAFDSQFFVGTLPWGQNPDITLIPGTNQAATVGKIDGPWSPFTLGSTQARRDRSIGSQGAIGARWDITPQLRATTELARTVSNFEREFPILDFLAHPTSVIGSTNVNGGAQISYPGYNMLDPKNYTLLGFYDNHSHDEGSSTDWRGDVTYDMDSTGFFREFSGGVRLAKRKAESIREKNGQGGLTSVMTADAIPGLACASHENTGNFGLQSWLTPCRDFMLNNTAALRQLFTGSSERSPDDPMTHYKDVEKTNAVYGKARIGFDLAQVPVDGTLGVRVVQTKQDLQGNSSQNGIVTPVRVKTSDTDVLPSMTLKAMLRQDLIARMTAGKAVQRPNFADFNPGVSLGQSLEMVRPTGSGGNPDLKPVEGKNLDVALEWYFAQTGSVTATVFRHNFKNYILSGSAKETYGGIEYDITRPRNTSKGHLQGLEMAYQQFYDKLPGWMSGLGLQANATYMTGELEELNGSVHPFTGMSKWSANIVGLYEQGPWSARLAYSWRDKYVDDYNYRGKGIHLTVAPTKTLDASVSYKLNPNTTVTLDANNLLDSTYRDYHDTPDYVRDVRRYDKVVGLSVRWSL